MPAITVVIPTLGRAATLGRALERLGAARRAEEIEVVVAIDAAERDPAPTEAAAAVARPFPVRTARGVRPGASATRNAGWRAATAPLVLFLDDDILAAPELIAEHLAWHERDPDERVGVLGHVRWADELRVTPFMHWFENGTQFDFSAIPGELAGWGNFYTANVSLKRALLERAGGFDELRFPFGYEDVELGWRLEQDGFRLLYNRAAVGEHLNATTLAQYRRRVERIARAERRWIEVHPELRPWFHDRIADALAQPPARGLARLLVKWVPRRPGGFTGWVWDRTGVYYRQQVGPAFMAAWAAAAAQAPEEAPAPPGGGVQPSGSSPGGPK